MVTKPEGRTHGQPPKAKPAPSPVPEGVHCPRIRAWGSRRRWTQRLLPIQELGPLCREEWPIDAGADKSSRDRKRRSAQSLERHFRQAFPRRVAPPGVPARKSTASPAALHRILHSCVVLFTLIDRLELGSVKCSIPARRVLREVVEKLHDLLGTRMLIT